MPSDNQGTTKKMYLSWVEIQMAVNQMASSLRVHGYKPRAILGVSRGGAIPAVMLSHRLDVPVVDFIGVNSYVNGKQQENVTISSDTRLFHGFDRADTLLIDDLWDTGHTMSELGLIFKNMTQATLYYKREKKNPPPPVGFPGIWLPHNQWVVFPWEVK